MTRHILLPVTILAMVILSAGCDSPDSFQMSNVAISETALADANGLERKVLKAIQSNRERLPNRAALTWEITTKQETEGARSKPIELHGNFEMWWQDEQVATRSRLEAVAVAPDNSRQIEKQGFCTAYDGDEFRRAENTPQPEEVTTLNKPKYRRHENWLEIIGWAKPPFTKLRRDDLSVRWSEKNEQGGRTATRSVSNAGGVVLMTETFDLQRGGEFVGHEWFDEKGRLYSRCEVSLGQVVDDVWFPTRRLEQAIIPASGIPDTNQSVLYQLNINDSRFGDEAELDKTYFDALPPFSAIDRSRKRGQLK